MNEATPEQLEAFKQGAAARYKELGVPPEKAVELFSQHMDKMAAYMNPQTEPGRGEAVSVPTGIDSTATSLPNTTAVKPAAGRPDVPPPNTMK